MDISSAKSGSSSSITQTSSLSAKMKRLQIEESLLLQSINKCVKEGSIYTDGEINAMSYLAASEFKAFSGNTKNSYREIKLLFQDIKSSTSSKEILKTLDMDEVKKNTLALDNRIKAFKLYLQTELAGLKLAEQQLNQSINENPVVINNLKRQPRIQTAKYNEIVPSPVKTLMTSPFKYSEVQQFQEFMMNSANRYGGWNEYHHNIFVKHWQKYFGCQSDNSIERIDNSVENSSELHLFLNELLPKLQDIREEEIIAHVKWYSKYIYLKERQQKAIDKWRSNRKVMKLAKAEPKIKKDMEIKSKSNGKRNNYNSFIEISSTDELDIIKDLVLQSPNCEPQQQKQDEVRFMRKCLIEDVQQGIYNMSDEDVCSNFCNVKNLTPKDRKSFGDQTLLHFQKPTKQWNFKIHSKDKDIKIETNMNNFENIKKLLVPAWRVGL